MNVHPLNIGHRGACGYLPEHTLESYQRAIDLGADILETDVVLSRDGHLICRHDCELSITTDVADRAEFASRRTVKTIDAETVQGWFIEDFTVDEIRTLRARQRYEFRDRSFDGRFGIPTLDDLLDFASRRRTHAGKPVGVIVEIKHAAYFDSLGLAMDEAVRRALETFSRIGSEMTIWVESFEIEVLKRLRRTIATPLIRLLDGAHFQPGDVIAAGRPLKFLDMISPAGLAEIATYAFAIGVWKRMILPVLPANASDSSELRLDAPTTLVADAHAAGLNIHAWTFRSEPRFLPVDYGGDPIREYAHFTAMGVDGFITDFPDAARTFLTTESRRIRR